MRRVVSFVMRSTAPLGIALICAQSSIGAEVPPLTRGTEMTPLAKQAVMESIAVAGNRLVAVGERGIVLRSDDEGKSWQQARAPVSVTLTAVQFVDAEHGWAVGHSGVVLSTQDGGAHWTRELDGAGAARLALIEAQALGTKSALSNARRLVAEGADKPFLSLSFRDAARGTVVGAYGLVMHTDDGGRTWQSWSARVGDPRGLHLYAVRQQGDSIWIAGEQGFVTRSLDSGATFTAAQTPYKGSFFALDLGRDGTVLLGGLLGKVFRSSDGGTSFSAVKLDGPVMITDVHYTSHGRWLVADAAGRVFASTDDAMTFTLLNEHPVFPLSGIALDAHGNIIGAGFAGVAPVPMTGSPNALSQQPADTTVSGDK